MVDILQEGFPALPSPDEHRYPLNTQDSVREYLRDLIRALEGQFNYQKTDADKLAAAVGTVFTSPLTTKGDIMAYSTTTGRFPVGTNGYYLVADSAQTFGIKYQALSLTTADLPAGTVLQMVSTSYSSLTSCTTTFPSDDTIPQNTEGDEVMTQAITPIGTNNKIVVVVSAVAGESTGPNEYHGMGLFQDSTADALKAVPLNVNANVFSSNNVLIHTMTAGTTSATTFKVRMGPDNGATVYFNGGNSGRIYGGVAASSITIYEIKA